MSDPECLVSSYTEWQPLEEVIIGHVFQIRTPVFDRSFQLFFSDNFHDGYFFSDPEFDLPNRFVEEGQEDLEEFSQILSDFGIKVRRPTNIFDGPTLFSTPYGWKGYASPALNVRDQCLIYGNTILETPPLVRTRFYENDQLKPLFYEYLKSGANWISAPRPIMTDNSFDDSYVRRTSPKNAGEAVSTVHDIGVEMMIDGAQCMRLGKDIIINVANKNHELGFKWLKRNLPDVRFHKICIADSHIDGRLVPLAPGKLLVDGRRIPSNDMLPPLLQTWDVIRVTEQELSKEAYQYEDISLASIAIDINVLSLDEKHVVVNKAATRMIKLLEKNGMIPVPVRFRHGRVLGGAFHCVTLDVRRRGDCEDYFT
ncbi:hypothetical protein MUU53_20925 [Rhizobium lemnae]|uniref:Glycine amidinotransferase n=1 Tax=Rhizobium lemnae TaxID=1214924 RepID=A0ABV8E4C3_9HYPH|nr:hypothetical protein [Rhizobium lemnae]MCJ8510351.1 hypothetical protein [Rhizobium lemnae]